MINPELKKLQVMAGILRDETQYIADGIILSEAEVLEFEQMWNEDLRLEAIQQLNEVDKEKVKQLMIVIKDLAIKVFAKIKGVGRQIWNNFWRLVGFVIKTVFLKPMGVIMGVLGIGAYAVLVDVLNFKIEPWTGPMGTEYGGFDSTMGSDMNAALMDKIAQGWSGLSDMIRGLDTTNLALKPGEWFMDAIALIMDAIGVAVPVAIDAGVAIFEFIFSMGIQEPIAVILLWLFLVGGGDWAFEKVKKFIVDPVKKLLNKPVDQAVDKAKEIAGPVSKDDAMKGLEPPADDMPGIGEPKTEAIAELNYLNEGAAGMLIKLISKIVGSVFRIAQIGFTGVGGTSGFVAGGMRGMSSGVIPRLIALVFDGLRLGANAGKFISGGIADLLGAPGKNLLDDEGNKVDPRVQRELMSIEKAVNEFVNSEEYDKSQLSNSLQSKLINYFKKQ